MQFKDKDLALFWENPAAFPLMRAPAQLRKTLYRKLQLINAACELRDLLVPPGNRLEALKGDRKGQFSIRVNQQWRLCFTWHDGEAQGVEFCDYHS